MKLFVGLGNPGAKYARNRHNIGFMAVDQIAADHGFSPWRSKFQGLVSEGRLGAEKVVLLKPHTFMNLSGQSVGEAMRFFDLVPSDITVLHDEIDLAPGKCRVKANGGHAGHNGLRSLHQHIGDDYWRVRIGVGHPGHKDRVPGYVLHDFAKADEAWVEDLIRGVSDGAVDLASGDTGRFMNAVALRVAPPRSSKTTATAKANNTSETTSKAAAASAKPAPQARPAPQTSDAPTEPRSALQRLADKFR